MKWMTNIAVALILLAATWVVHGGIKHPSARKGIVAHTAITP